MANVSSAYGYMTLKGAWPLALITNLNTIASEIWAKCFYNIELDPFDHAGVQHECSAIFSGNGRWAFHSNMECLGTWTAEEIKEKPEHISIYNELMTGMHENGLTVEVSYSDEEGGCLILYRQDGILSSDGEMLVYQVTSEGHLKYNWENYMDVTGDADQYDSLVESLCEMLGLDNDESGMVGHWAAARTYPHYESYNGLDPDTQSEFKEVFRRIPDGGELERYLKFADTAEHLAGNGRINAPSGAELVDFYIANIAGFQEQDQDPSETGYMEFVAKRLVDECGYEADDHGA